MKYMGSKRRIAQQIIPIMLKGIKPEQYFVDLFCGGCNLINHVSHPLRIANDINKPLIELHKALVNGWTPPAHITREEYYHIKKNTWLYDHHLVGYACFCASYSGKPFSGYAGDVIGKDGVTRDYQNEAKRLLAKELALKKGIIFYNRSYEKIAIPKGAVVYADKPYKGVTGYRVPFDHDRFFNWARERAEQKIKVFISEYSAPKDFVSIWSTPLRGSLNSNGMYSGLKKPLTVVEKLFIHNSFLEPWML